MMTTTEERWARTANAGDYLARYDDDDLTPETDPGSRCGHTDMALDEIRKVLESRGLRLEADDRGLVVAGPTVTSPRKDSLDVIGGRISGMPCGRSWSQSGEHTEVVIVWRATGEWRVHCGWRVEESYGDDPGSISSPIPRLRGRAHVGWSVTCASREEAEGIFRRALISTTAPPCAKKWEAR